MVASKQSSSSCSNPEALVGFLRNFFVCQRVFFGLFKSKFFSIDFFVHRNKLTGTIPPELGGATTLRELHVHFNKLTGTLPTELAALTDLQSLYLYDNQFSGSIDVLSYMVSMDTFIH
jgi:Leucine-rich repeat (LRR) protein